MHKAEALIELINESKVLLLSKEGFDNWVILMSKSNLNLEDTKKVSRIIQKYKELHYGSEEMTKMLTIDLQLLNQLNISKSELENDYELVNDILPLLNEEYFTNTKSINIVKHQCFPGIPDLGSPLMGEINNEFRIKNFDELIKAVVMVQNRRIYDSNYDWLIDVDNPSLSNCVCFKEDADKLDKSDNCNNGFIRDAGFLPSKDLVIEHTKNVIRIAKVYLKEPLRYYKAYVNIHKEKINELDLTKDLIEQILHSTDIELETAVIVLIDMLEHGFSYEDVGLHKENR